MSGFLILFTLASISMMIYVDSLKVKKSRQKYSIHVNIVITNCTCCKCHHVTELEKAINKGDLQKVEKSLKESNIDEENCVSIYVLLTSCLYMRSTLLEHFSITNVMSERYIVRMEYTRIKYNKIPKTE